MNKWRTFAKKILVALVICGGIFNLLEGASIPAVRAQSQLPNLTPEAPAGWESPMIASSTKGTLRNDVLVEDQYTYIDWVIKNIGSATVAPFKTCVYYDDLELQCWTSDGLGSEEFFAQNDWVLTIPVTDGRHHLRVVTDVDNAVAESNEADNSWEADFEWQQGNTPAFLEPALINDVRTKPTTKPSREDAHTSATQSPAISYAPGYYSTSDYMISSVAVGIIFPESIDNGENWSQARKDQVVAEIQTGLNWWVQQANLNGMDLSFSYDVRTVPTSYEPITMPSTDSRWVSEAMSNLGYDGSSAYIQTRDYINNLREQKKTKWGYMFLVVDSLNDLDGKFSDGAFAYSYLGGPYVVLTYDNSSWGISNMDKVSAHETAHIFYAGDNYYQAWYGGCTSTTELYGYLGVANSNCAYNNPGADTNVIMNNNSWNLHWTTAQQIGWRDSDANGIKDPLDTTPIIEMNVHPSPLPAKTPITFTGSVYEIPYPHNPNSCCAWYDTNINTIASVQYRIDNADWLDATATDGAFDTDNEKITLTVPELGAGLHTLEVKARNSNSTSNPIYWSDTINAQELTADITAATTPEIINLDPEMPTNITYVFTETNGGTGRVTSHTEQYYTDENTSLDSANTYPDNISISPNQTTSWIETITLPDSVVAQARAAGKYTITLKTSFSVTSNNNDFTVPVSVSITLRPSPFNKTGPLNSATIPADNIILNWEPATGASSYIVCYNTVNDESCANQIKTNSLFVTLNGLPATIYHWQVSAINESGITEANDRTWYSFTTIQNNSKVFRSATKYDGWLLELTEISNSANQKCTMQPLRIGDDAYNRQYRSILSFYPSNLPKDAVIAKAFVKIKIASVTGSDPLTIFSHGNLIADIKKGCFGSCGLELADFNTENKVIPNVGEFKPIGDNWYQLTLDAQYLKYINKYGDTQFRLRFTKDDDNDRSADYVSFFAGNTNAIADRPQLVIEYYFP